MYFSKFEYVGEHFANLNLESQVFEGKEFEDCVFQLCSFINGEFKNCKFINCKFIDCTLSAVSIKGSSFVDVSFQNSKVIGMDWTTGSRIHNLSFEKCQINYSNFRLLKLPGIKILDTEAKEVDFASTDLRKSLLMGTDFERSIFHTTNLDGADLTRAINYYIDIHHNSLKGAKFSMPDALNLFASLGVIIE